MGDQLPGVFAEVKTLSLSSREDIPPRIKFLMKDIADMRAAGWDRTTKRNAPEGPMRMADVQKQWAKDHAEPQRPHKGGKTPAPLQDDDEWATVGKSRMKGAATT